MPTCDTTQPTGMAINCHNSAWALSATSPMTNPEINTTIPTRLAQNPIERRRATRWSSRTIVMRTVTVLIVPQHQAGVLPTQAKGVAHDRPQRCLAWLVGHIVQITLWVGGFIIPGRRD